MALGHGPTVVTNGLVLALDAADRNSFDSNENLITHSSMSGWTVGVLGSGGALPTGWGLDQLQPGSTIQIIGGGVEDGLNYVDIRFFATSVSTSNRTLIRPGNSVTTDGSTYYLTTYSKLVSGSTNNLTHINFHTGALSLTSVLTRNIGAAAVLSGTFFPRYDIGYNGTGVAYDITIRFAAPQLERGSSSSPYYPTTGTAKNRGTTWIDLTGNGNNGTLVNGATYSSANGGVIALDGVNDYIDVPINLTNTNYTIMGAARYVVVGGRTFSGKINNWLMGHWGNTTRNHYAEGWVSSVANGEVDTNWRIYAATGNYSGDSWAQYVNGALDSGPNNSGLTGPNGFAIGSAQASSEFSNSHISNLIVYNRVLTSSEIQQNFNALRRRLGI
jgi:hypothetical protein